MQKAAGRAERVASQRPPAVSMLTPRGYLREERPVASEGKLRDALGKAHPDKNISMHELRLGLYGRDEVATLPLPSLGPLRWRRKRKDEDSTGILAAAGSCTLGKHYTTLSDADRVRFGLEHFAMGQSAGESHGTPLWSDLPRGDDTPSLIELLARLSASGVKGPLQEIHASEQRLWKLQC
mmetsp:Transcript_4415/g.9623  ORF Transcript_4415/g.9623 Transcript_4415/m.9623 type:complete len:181 (+) Transcript_4415:91-633(+)